MLYALYCRVAAPPYPAYKEGLFKPHHRMLLIRRLQLGNLFGRQRDIHRV